METTRHSPPWAGESLFHMIDVGEKPATRRRAIARGSAHLAPDAFAALRDGKNPKGNVLALAEAAGILAAKKTAELIPLCHPLPLDYVHVKFSLDEKTQSVTVFCEAGTSAKTGVEMEALCGVNGALLTIYDLSKAVNPVIRLSDIRLDVKEGGKSGTWTHPEYEETEPGPTLRLENVRAAVLTVSDRVSRGLNEDLSGPLLAKRLTSEGARVVSRRVVPDEKETIQAALKEMIAAEPIELLITTGGTGLSPRDVTPEAVEAIASRTIPGIGEVLRREGARHIKSAWLSRQFACLVGDTLVITLPGSRNAVTESMDTLLPLLPHALHTLRGGDHA